MSIKLTQFWNQTLYLSFKAQNLFFYPSISRCNQRIEFEIKVSLYNQNILHRSDTFILKVTKCLILLVISILYFLILFNLLQDYNTNVLTFRKILRIFDKR